MKLAHIFSGDKQTSDSNPIKGSVVKSDGLLSRQIKALVPGQTITGEVIAKNGSEVQIKLSEDMVIKARIEQAIKLELCRLMTFEVKNNGQTLSLLPLYANTAQDANVLKALSMASLPVNVETTAMTELMMKAGLSIDKASLQQLFRECSQYGAALAADIVRLHKLGIPVSSEGLEQLAAYKNQEHQLNTGLSDCLKALPETIERLVRAGDIKEAVEIYSTLLGFVDEADFAREGAAATASAADAENVGIKADEAQIPEMEESRRINTALLQDTEAGLKETVQEETEPAVHTSKEAEETIKEQVKAFRQQPEAETLIKIIQETGEKDVRLTRKLLCSRELLETVQNKLKESWFIRPEDVADKEKIEELYDRLCRQLKELSHTLKQAGETQSGLAEKVNTLNRNLDFLQQLNQTYTYIQLPLSLQQGKNANGELLVYTNKKHMAAADGQISALLHLDMEQLGPMDIYVIMKEQSVSTKFYVQEELLDFLEPRLDILTKRLLNKGYNCSCETAVRDEKVQTADRMQQIIQADAQMPIVRYAFDVRT